MPADDKPGVFFDLDGTLTDPYVGISRSIRHAMRALNVEPVDDLRWCIGPSLLASLSTLVGARRAKDALALYRERFSDVGWKENTPYEGIRHVLSDLKERGHALYVATAKPKVFADRIVDHFEFREFFTAVYGPELDGRFGDKSDLLKMALVESPQKRQAIMIGDRQHDMIAARDNGLYPVGVSYGFGSVDELKSSGAEELVDRPHGIPEISRLSAASG